MGHCKNNYPEPDQMEKPCRVPMLQGGGKLRRKKESRKVIALACFDQNFSIRKNVEKIELNNYPNLVNLLVIRVPKKYMDEYFASHIVLKIFFDLV